MNLIATYLTGVREDGPRAIATIRQRYAGGLGRLRDSLPRDALMNRTPPDSAEFASGVAIT